MYCCYIQLLSDTLLAGKRTNQPLFYHPSLYILIISSANQNNNTCLTFMHDVTTLLRWRITFFFNILLRTLLGQGRREFWPIKIEAQNAFTFEYDPHPSIHILIILYSSRDSRHNVWHARHLTPLYMF